MKAIKPYLDGKTHIIWDWNGTLLNDLDHCIESIGDLLDEHSLPRVSEKQYRELFRFPVQEYYRDVGFDFERTPFEILANGFMTRYLSGVLNCQLFNGTQELLSDLKNEGISHSILSASRENYLHEQVTYFKIDHYFDAICGLSDHYAMSKIARGKQLIEQLNLPLSSTLLIGDTDHDLAVGNELGVEVLLLGDGHQSATRLQRIHPKVLATREPK